jgi:hypothetical protein
VKVEITYLEIGCWKGFGGEHYWGQVKYKDHTIKGWDVEHPLSAKEAKYLNKKDETSGFSRHKPGEMSERFETREELVAFTAKEVKKRHPESVLVVGSVCSASPHEIVMAPERFKSRVKVMNKMWVKFESLYGDRTVPSDEKLADKLSDDWCDLLDSFNDE